MPRTRTARTLAAATVAAVTTSVILTTGAVGASKPDQAPTATVPPRAAEVATGHEEAPGCVREEQSRPIYEFVSHRELGVELQRLAEVSEGRVAVEEFGQTNRGRALWSATVGEGDRVVMVTSEIHGDEKTGTEALLRILETMGTSESATARRLREEITLVAVPKINADAAELDRRGNDRSWDEVVADFPQLEGVEPAWNYIDEEQSNDDYTEAPGFDVNRDFNADLGYVPQPSDFPGTSEDFGWFIQPESQALRDLYVGLRDEHGSVDVYVDLHHQGPCVAQEGSLRLLDVGIDYPPLPDEQFAPGGDYAEYADVYRRDYSIQLATSAFNAMERDGYLPARYPHPEERDVPGQARSAFALNGTGTVLFEVRGQTEHFGHEGRERFTNAVVSGLTGMLNDVATGAVTRIDPEGFSTLPGTVDLRGEGGAAAQRAAAGVEKDAAAAQVQEQLG